MIIVSLEVMVCQADKQNLFTPFKDGFSELYIIIFSFFLAVKFLHKIPVQATWGFEHPNLLQLDTWSKEIGNTNISASNFIYLPFETPKIII